MSENFEEKLKKTIENVAALLDEPVEHMQIELIGYLKGRLARALIAKQKNGSNI